MYLFRQGTISMESDSFEDCMAFMECDEFI